MRCSLKIPLEYLEGLKELARTNIQLGYLGIHLFRRDEIEEGQVGYSIAPDGRSLSGSTDGDWKPNWVVIGNETGLGDPFFIDGESALSPVMTAMHGEGAWVPVIIAADFKGFFSILGRLVEIAQGGNWPVTKKEKDEFLIEVENSKGQGASDKLWRVLIGLEE